MSNTKAEIIEMKQREEKQKHDTTFLVFNAKVFVERELHKSKIKYFFSRFLFITLNVFALLGAFVISIITALVFSKQIWTSVPTWYFFVTTGVGSITSFLTALINIFYVKKKMNVFKNRVKFIYGEIILFESNSGIYKTSKNKEFLIFHRLTLKMDYKLAKEREDAGGTNEKK